MTFFRTFTLVFVIALLTGCSPSHQRLSQKELDQQLVIAIDKGDISAVTHLLDAGASLEAANKYGQTALGIAGGNRQEAIVELLLKRGADPALLNSGRPLTLAEAARDTDTRIFEALLARTPDAGQRKEALFAVASMGVAVVVIAEPSNTPKPAQPEHSNWYRAAELLLDNGIPVDTRDQENSTPLITAAAHGQEELFELFLERGADINATDKYGNTALIAAACECAVATMPSTYEIVQTLLDRGANVNARALDGTTALMNAVGGFGGTANVELLISRGANLRARDNKGKTAMKIAEEGSRPEMVKFMRDALKRAGPANSHDSR